MFIKVWFARKAEDVDSWVNTKTKRSVCCAVYSIFTVFNRSQVLYSSGGYTFKTQIFFSTQKHLAEADFQFPGVHRTQSFKLVVRLANPGGPLATKTLLEGSQRASRIGWGMKKDRWHELRCVAWREQLAQAARVKIGCANCAETTGGTATRIFEETRAAWSLLHPHGGQEDGFHAFSCTEGHTWEGKPGSISRGCLGFLVCLQSRRCYTFFFSIFFFFFGDRVPQISIQMLNKIVNQRESWRGMHWN